MGIPGLLQGLKSYTQAGNIRDFRGQAIAVDASSWLHKSIYNIAEHYVEATWGNTTTNNNDSSSNTEVDDDDAQQQHSVVVDAHSVQVSTDYMLKRCQELVQHAGIRRIYLVFDGKRCPLKAGTNAERERKRSEHLAEARKYRKLLAAQQSSSSHAQKQQYREQMFHHYKICIKVTQALADAVADKLQQYSRNHNNNNNNRSCPPFELVFSPYEADAQLVQLVVAGLAQAVVTEDSDVLVYSAACQYAFPTLFKLDRQTGSCQILSLDFLLVDGTCSSSGDSSNNNNNNKTAAASRKQRHHPPPRRSALLPMTAAEREELDKKKASSSNNNGNSQLEKILSCFAERQGRDPGRGSRLFVQACILTGCDYAPNLLQGIGLVTAFKHVRSCMHKSPDQRFRQVLKLLPPKAKRAILLQQYQQQQQKQPIITGNHNNLTSSSSSSSPMDAYEELLAKSEAVFYYHPVLDTVARRVTFFTPPNTTTTTTTTTRNSGSSNNNQNGSVNNNNNNGHYRPSLARFHGDWSFLSNNPQDYHHHNLLQPQSAARPDAGGHDDDDDDEDDTQPLDFHSFSYTSSRRPHLATNKSAAPPINVAATTRTAQQPPISKPVPPFVVMANPYRRANKKRPIQEDENNENNNRPEKRKRGGPLAPKSPNLESKKKNTRKEQKQQRKGRHSSPNKNLFAKFAAHKNNNDKENPPCDDDDDDRGKQQQQQHNLQAFFNNRKESDVRFVKPVFDEKGNRIVLAAQKLPTTLPCGLHVASSQQHAPPPPPPPVAASFLSQHAPPPRPIPFAVDSAQQQQEHDVSTTRQQQSRNSESESNYFSQRAAKQRQQQECSGIIRDHDSRLAEQPSFGLLAGLDDDDEEENVSECIDDTNRQWQQQEQPSSSFLEPSTTHCSRLKENTTLLPLVSSEEGFDYEEEQVETYYQPEYYSSTLAAPAASLRFASHGDNHEQVNDDDAAFQNHSFCDNVKDDMAQDRHQSVLSSRPLFAKDAHSFPTGLDFEEEESEEAVYNFNDLTAPPSLRNPPFCNDGDMNNTSHIALSSRPLLGLEFTEEENENGNGNFFDLTEASCPPFENPAFCPDEKEEPTATTTTRSDYFARPRLGNGFSRRVTLESPTQQPTAAATTTTAGRLHNNPIFQPDLPRPAQFDLYDDFFSPKKAPPSDEDIEDSPLNFGNHHPHRRPGQHGVSLSLNLYSQRSAHQPAAPPPKPNSTIGPAKTLRKRFKSCGTVNNNNPLAKAFERQRQIAAFEGITTNSSSGRGGGQQQASSQARRRRLPNLNQSTLMFSFSSTSHHRK